MVNFGVSSFVNFVRSRKGLMRPGFFSLESTLLKIVTTFLTNPWLFDLLLCRKVYQTMVLAIGSILFKSPVEFMEKINHQVTAIHLLLVVQQNIVSPCPEVSFYKISEVHEGSPQHIYHALTCQGKCFLVTFSTTRIYACRTQD